MKVANELRIVALKNHSQKSLDNTHMALSISSSYKKIHPWRNISFFVEVGKTRGERIFKIGGWPFDPKVNYNHSQLQNKFFSKIDFFIGIIN